MRTLESVKDVEAGWVHVFKSLGDEDGVTPEIAIPLEMPTPKQLFRAADAVKGLCCGSYEELIWVESEEKYYWYLASFGH